MLADVQAAAERVPAADGELEAAREDPRSKIQAAHREGVPVAKPRVAKP